MQQVIDSQAADILVKDRLITEAMAEKADSAAKKGDQQKGHGGWMPKCAILAHCYNKQQWGKCHSLINEFRQGSEVFDSLLTAKAKGKGKGKGKAKGK